MTSLTYTLIRSARRTLSLEINVRGELIVRAPNRMSRRQIDAFLESRRDWILEKQALRTAVLPRRTLTAEELKRLRAEAAAWFPPEVQAQARRMGQSCPPITIRTQRTRWGSCSSTGHVNLNALLMLAPEEVRRYVIIHELCHRWEMNHSPAFWQLVSTYCPDYRTQMAWLKNQGSGLMAALPD